MISYEHWQYRVCTDVGMEWPLSWPVLPGLDYTLPIAYLPRLTRVVFLSHLYVGYAVYVLSSKF